MKTNLQHQSPADFATPLLVVFAIDTTTAKDAPATPELLTTDPALLAAAAPWLTSGEFKATLGETFLLPAPQGLKAQRLLLVGAGKSGKLTPHELRKAAGAAVRYARPKGLRTLALTFPEHPTLPTPLTARALAEGAIVADFDIDFYRADRKDLSIQQLTVLAPSVDEATETAFREGIILAESQNFARTLINEPGNILTPTELGKRTSAMAQELTAQDFGLSCEVHTMDKLRELKMGAFIAVAQGSPEPPALIVLRYEPPTAPAANAPVIGLVGKGITFDTGGISIKPAADMDKMKYDMAGAASMIASMRAIAQLKPNVRVLCVVCSCENMPDGLAFKPGDVVTAMSGKTIEIMNTDAEGRLVLADGLHYAQTLGATHLINAATLTGAIGTALGQVNAGLFSNDDATTQRFLDALSITGEKFWRMPCTDDYRDQIKSQIADIMNSTGSRYGGATTAAMFLKEFVGDSPLIPWIHLDIASTTWLDDQKAWQSKGPSGVAIRTITEWVRSYAGSQASDQAN
ncbi:MAG: leucyl aminopeptidase [Acidobacteriaceae bacterium]